MNQGAWRMAALVAALVGGAGAVGLTLYAGRQNQQPFLMVLMSVWVAAPFLALAVANKLSSHWLALTRTALQGVTFVVVIATLALFGRTAANPPRTTRGPVFVALPVVSWLLMASVIPIAAWISRRRTRRG